MCFSQPSKSSFASLSPYRDLGAYGVHATRIRLSLVLACLALERLGRLPPQAELTGHLATTRHSLGNSPPQS